MANASSHKRSRIVIENVEANLVPTSAAAEVASARSLPSFLDLNQQIDLSFTSTSMLEEENHHHQQHALSTAKASNNGRQAAPPGMPAELPRSKRSNLTKRSNSTKSSSGASFFFQADWLNAANPQPTAPSIDGTTTQQHDLCRRHHQGLLVLQPDDDDDDDDDRSTRSEPYYDISDFSKSFWSRAMQNVDVSAMGFALVALTTAITHPLLFVAGALTAVGTATAVGHAYDSLRQGVLGKYLFSCGDDSVAAVARDDDMDRPWSGTVDEATTTPMEGSDAVLPQPKLLPSTTTLQLLGSPPPQQQQPTSNLGDRLLLQHEPSGATTVAVAPQLLYDLRSPDGTLNSLLNNNNAPTTIMSLQEEAAIHQVMVDALYPKLEHTVVEEGDFIGLNVLQFFSVFLSDKAPYNFIEFQKKRGDKDILYGNWSDLDPTTHTLSLHPDITTNTTTTTPWLMPADWSYLGLQGRTIQFAAKTNAFMAPPYANTIKEQRVWVKSKRLAVLDTRTTLSNIPFCDRFVVLERWVLQAHKTEQQDDDETCPITSSGGTYRLRLQASCQVVFSNSCPFEAQIKSKSLATITEVSQAWVQMARSAMELTKQAKMDRLNNAHTMESLSPVARTPQQQQQQQHAGAAADLADSTGTLVATTSIAASSSRGTDVAAAADGTRHVGNKKKGRASNISTSVLEPGVTDATEGWPGVEVQTPAAAAEHHSRRRQAQSASPKRSTRRPYRRQQSTPRLRDKNDAAAAPTELEEPPPPATALPSTPLTRPSWGRSLSSFWLRKSTTQKTPVIIVEEESVVVLSAVGLHEC